MRVIEDAFDTVKCFDYEVWKQEKNLIFFEHNPEEEPASSIKLYAGLFAQRNLLATYSLDANNSAVIDVSDYIRAHPECTQFVVECVDAWIDIPFEVVGLINPENVIIPCNYYADRVREALEVDWRNMILLPSMIYQDLGINRGLSVELYPTDDDSPNYTYGISVGGVEFNDVARKNAIPVGASKIRTIAVDIAETIQEVQLRPLDDCAKYVAVRWVSFTGVTRLHTFELRDAMQTTDETIKLETMDGSYNQINGRTDGFKLYLDELTAYDYWYYADVINSSKVEVSLDGMTWQQVEVVTKSVTIPNTNHGKTNKLEIAINWRNYDAVTM